MPDLLRLVRNRETILKPPGPTQAELQLLGGVVHVWEEHAWVLLVICCQVLTHVHLVRVGGHAVAQQPVQHPSLYLQVKP